MVRKYILKSIHIAYFFIIPVLILGVSVGYTSFLTLLEALLILLLVSNRHSVGIFFIMYGGPLGGIIRLFLPGIPIYGVLLVAFGLWLVRDSILEFFRTQLPSLLWLGLLLFIFFIYYLMGQMDEFASVKYFKMCGHATIMLAGYYALNTSKKIDPEGLLRLMLLGAMLMFVFVTIFYDFVPGALFDYDWFREQVVEWTVTYGETDINYQHIGMLVLYGISIYLAQLKLNPWKTAFYLICSAQLILVSGCRQAILGLMVVVFLRFTIFSFSSVVRKYNPTAEVGYRLFGRILAFVFRLALAFALGLMIISMLSYDIDVVSNTLDEGDVSRFYLFYQAWNLFLDHPLGVGIGGFHFYTGEVWPHNFILELLCETGIIGSLVFLALIIINLIYKHIGLFYVTKSNLFYFIIISALFVRIMVSTDLSESIEFFSAIFAIPPLLKSKKVLTQ